MRIKFQLTLSFLIFSTAAVFGQLEKTIHQTFEVGDASSIKLDLYGEYIVEPWAGSTLMTETKIELYEASPSILNHFVEKEQRYFIEADTTGGNFILRSFDKKRTAIRTRSGECFEIVKLKVYTPDNYAVKDETTLVKKDHE